MPEDTGIPTGTQEAPVENQDAQPEGKAPVAPPEVAVDGVDKMVAKAARKLKLKIDGQESEYDEADVIALAQQSKAAQKRFNEASKMRKEAEQLIQMLKEDPRSVLEHESIGLDAKKWAEDLLLAELEKAELSPEARRAYEAEEKLKAYEKEKEDASKKREHEDGIKLQARFVQEYEASIQAALEKVDIPKTPQSVARMATLMHSALENGHEIDATQAANLVRQEYLGDMLTLLGKADGETLIKLLGEGVATKIRKTDLARLETRLKKAQTPEGESAVDALESMPTTTREEAGAKKMNTLEFREYLEKLRSESK